MFEDADDQVIAKYFSYLRLIHPDLADDDVVATRVSRSRYVFPVPLVDGPPTLEPGAESSVAGLYLLGSACLRDGTSTIEQTLANAEAALERFRIPSSTKESRHVGQPVG